MIIAKCDKCGEEFDHEDDLEKVYLYEDKFDLCEKCYEIYDKTEINTIFIDGRLWRKGGI